MRSAAFQVAFLTAAAVAARMGTAQIAAHQIGLQLWEFTALLLDSFAIAAQSLVGAALGGSATRPPLGTLPGRSRAGGCGRLSSSPRLRAPAGQSSRGCSRSSAAVQHQVHVLWPWFVGMLPIAGVVFALDGVLIGAGDVAFLRTITIVAARRRVRPDQSRRTALELGNRRSLGRTARLRRRAPGRHVAPHARRPLGGHRPVGRRRLTLN